MKVYELAKKLKKSNKELIADMDDPRVKSHLSKVPDDILAEFDVDEKKITTEPEPTPTVDSAETTVVDVEIAEKQTEAEECPYTLSQIAVGIRMCGNKSKAWKWRHLIG
jgi:hypothetical protein